MAESRRFAQFTLARRIGEGGMGVVWEAYDERRRRVALKTLREVDAHSLYLFKNEFRELADLRHPNLVELGELVCHEGQWFFTMELVDGVDLLAWVRGTNVATTHPSLARTTSGELDGTLPPAAMMAPTYDGLETPARWPDHSYTMPAVGRRAHGGFDEGRVRAAFAQLAEALDALHAAGKVHRDVKPSNVLVDRSGRVVLLDFGLVAAVRGDVEEQVVGTPAYMAPEQAGSRPISPAADMYSVGTVLYEALTGRLPFEGRPLAVLMAKQRGAPPPPRELVDDVPADLERVCLQLLDVDPAARPSAAELALRLGGIARGTAPVRGTAALPFVGRDHEREQLGALLARSRGDGVAVLVDGESGVGKSALVQRFTDEARAADPTTVVLWGRCYERESVPYQAFDRVVDALSQRLGRSDDVPVPPNPAALVRLFPVLRRVPSLAAAAAAAPAPASPRAQRAAGFAALRALLGAIARRGPLIVVIDDLQWADGDSWDLLAEVLRPPAPAMLLIAIGRGVRAPDSVGVMAQLQRIPLGTLPPADALRLAALLGVVSGDRLVAETGGHPMFLHEMARSPDARADTLEEVLGRRIGALDGEARTLLETVAIAGGPISLDVAAGAARLDAEAAAHAVATLRAGHLARGGAGRSEHVETYHDRVRAAVVAGLDEAGRRRAHEALGRALEASGSADPQVLVMHLERAGQAIAAAFHAERGARAAVEILAFEQAAALWETALRLGRHTADRRRELLRARADALANAGRGAEAAAVYLVAADGMGPTDRLDCQRRAAEHLLGSGHVARGFEVLREVLAEFGEGLPATPRRALLRLLWSRARIRLGGLRWTPRDIGDISPRELVRLDAFKAVAVSLAPIDLMRGAEFQARLLRSALRVGERRHVARALMLEAVYITTAGRRHEARGREILSRARAIADETDDRYLHVWRLGAEGMLLHNCGRFGQAARMLGEAAEQVREIVDVTPCEFDIVHLFGILSWRLTGRMAEVLAPFEGYLRDARDRGDRFSETMLVMAVNMTWLAMDQPAQAVEAIDEVAWQPLPDSYHSQHFYGLLARLEHALYVGDVGVRARLAPEMAALDRSFFASVETVKAQRAYMYGRLALAEALAGRGELAPVAQWARRLEALGLDYATVWGRALLAGHAIARGDDEAARLRLTEVIALADGDADQPLLAACARLRLARVVTGDLGVDLGGAAAAAFDELGIVNAPRMADVWLPWPRGERG